MKKILFAIKWYPPRASANVLCDEKIIRKLIADNEYEVHCLVYRAKGTKKCEIIDGLHVNRISIGPLFKHYIWSKDHNSKLGILFQRFCLRLKQILTIWIYPCYEPFLAHKFAKEAIKLHKQEHFDLIVSEHHGFDTLYAGHKLKKEYPDVKFMAILWDPFTGKEPAKYLPKQYAENKLLRAENEILSNADKIVAMKSSEEYHLENSIAKSYFTKYCFLDIPGIVAPIISDIDNNMVKMERINIIFSGVLSLPERNPEYIIRALNETRYANQLHLIFLCVGSGRNVVEDMKRIFKGEITVSGYIDRKMLSSVYADAQVLLNFGGSNPVMVPSKIFEYMSYGKPILSTYYIDNESSKKYFERYPLALCVDERESIENNVKRLEQFIDSTIGKTVSFEEVKMLFPENTPDKYVEIIERTLEE